MNESLVVIVRALIAFFSLLIFTRFLGKQQISQLSFFDYISGITIGSIAAKLTIDLTIRAWTHWLGLFMWVTFVFILQWLSLRGRTIAKYIDGEPKVVIMDGKIMDQTLKEARYRIADLLKLLREKGIFDLNDVRYAVLETDGHLSVFPTRRDTSYRGISKQLIYDGKIMRQTLEQIGRSESWLLEVIQKEGYQTVTDVFLLLINDKGKIFIDGYDDQINDVSQKNLE